jgi:hypothetical protein
MRFSYIQVNTTRDSAIQVKLKKWQLHNGALPRKLKILQIAKIFNADRDSAILCDYDGIKY